MTGGEFTKGELITLCEKAVNKHKTVDITIFPVYIERYMAAALNFSMTKQYYIDRKNEDAREINGAFIGVYPEVELSFDDVRKSHYAVLPARLVPLPVNKAILYAGPVDVEENEFVLVDQRDRMLAGKWMNHSNRIFGQLEGNKIYFKRIPDAVTSIMIKMIVSLSDLEIDDIVPIPAGAEIEVIQIVEQFFLGQRQLPENKLIDNREADVKQ